MTYAEIDTSAIHLAGAGPAQQPAPEVPARGHPLPQPEEAPPDSPQEIPVDVPEGPGPVFDGAFWSRPVSEIRIAPGRKADPRKR